MDARKKHPAVAFASVILIFFSLQFYLSVYWAACVFVAVHGLSQVVVNGSYCLVAMHRLLMAVTILVVVHGLWASALVIVVDQLSCSEACRIFLDLGRTHVLCIGRPILNHWIRKSFISFLIVPEACE